MKYAFASLAVLAATATVPVLGQGLVQAGAGVEFVWPHPRAGYDRCLIASGENDGDAVIMHGGPCEEVSQNYRTWFVAAGSGPSGPAGRIRLVGNKCLDVREGVNADGTRLQVWTCNNGNPNQLFTVNDADQSIRWAGTNKCLDVTGGVIATGTPIQLWTCWDGNSNQKWYPITRISPVLRAPVNEPVNWQTGLVAQRFAPCITAMSNTDGGEVRMQQCFGGDPAARAWTAPGGGAWSNTGPGPLTHIRVFGDKCLDVPNGQAVDGTKLQVWTCNEGNPNQLWRINGDATISWANTNFCVDLTEGDYTNPTQIQIWSCWPQNPNQLWGSIPPA